MKITANIPNDLIQNVKKIAKVPTLTEAMILALSEWVALNGLKEKNQELRRSPLKLEGLDSNHLRELNRKK